MKVLLVMPPEMASTLVHTAPPYSILVLAASVRLAGHEVRLLDCFTFGYNEAEFKILLEEYKPDVVGVSGMYCHHNEMLMIAKVAKQYSKALVAVGGVHATAMPELLLKDQNIDVLFRGEADEIFPKYLAELAKGNKTTEIPGVCFRTASGVHVTAPVTVAELDTLPFPAWDLLPPTKYKGAPHGFFYRGWPIGLILSSRGCPFKCTYCAGPLVGTRKWRSMSPQRIIAEIKYLVDTFGVKEIEFIDDNFTLNKRRVLEFCGLVKRSGLKVWFSCPNGVRLDTLDDEVLAALKEAGFYNFSLG